MKYSMVIFSLLSLVLIPCCAETMKKSDKLIAKTLKVLATEKTFDTKPKFGTNISSKLPTQKLKILPTTTASWKQRNDLTNVMKFKTTSTKVKNSARRNGKILDSNEPGIGITGVSRNQDGLNKTTVFKVTMQPTLKLPLTLLTTENKGVPRIQDGLNKIIIFRVTMQPTLELPSISLTTENKDYRVVNSVQQILKMRSLSTWNIPTILNLFVTNKPFNAKETTKKHVKKYVTKIKVVTARQLMTKIATTSSIQLKKDVEQSFLMTRIVKENMTKPTLMTEKEIFTNEILITTSMPKNYPIKNILEYRGVYYYIHDHKIGTKNWFDARDFCREMNMELVTIDDAIENNFIARILFTMEPDFYWIGLNDIDIEGEFRWSSNNKDISYFVDWEIGEPNGGYLLGEDCVQFAKRLIENRLSFHWNDDVCINLGSFICESLH